MRVFFFCHWQTFRKYLEFRKDTTELLYFILRHMSIDQQRYIRGISGVEVNVLEIHEKDFLEKVNLRGFVEVRFYSSVNLNNVNLIFYLGENDRCIRREIFLRKRYFQRKQLFLRPAQKTHHSHSICETNIPSLN